VRHLVEAAGLDDRHGVGKSGVRRGAELQASDRVAVTRRRVREAERGPHEVGIEADRALVGLEVSHDAGQRIALLDELDEARVDIDRLAVRRDVAGNAHQPAIGRCAEAPGVGINRGFLRFFFGKGVARTGAERG
jgi:hypothetical protein